MVQVDYDADPGGIFKAKYHRTDSGLYEVIETKDTLIEKTIDQLPTHEVTVS